ncbi:lasso RiPP family leader peptide-containing protein [Erythrobacter sp.]
MTNKTQKSKYSAPRLTEFGSVRNLTGGSNTRFRDGENNNTATRF